MKENEQRSLILIIITIAVFSVAIIGATYAFFATTRNVNNAINASVGTAASMYSFSASSNGNIEMNILFNEMSEANVSTNVLKTDNATINVSLASPTNDMKTVCTYDIVWVWDSDDKYTTPDVILPICDGIEDTGTDKNGNIIFRYCGGKDYNYEFSAKVDSNEEKDLSKYPISGNKVTLQKDVSIESNSTTATTKTHRIDAYIYNIPVDQEKLFDKSFKAHITIDNLSCNMKSSVMEPAKYWNDDFGYNFYKHPNTPSITYESVEELQEGYNNFSNQPYYIKTTDKEHLACLFYNNNEFCLGANYWETDGETTKGKLKAAMEESLETSIPDDSCSTNPFYIECSVGDFECGVYPNGIVYFSGVATSYNCLVGVNGDADCGDAMG